jgi:hypothetical protein
MIAIQHLEVLRKIVTRLKGNPVNWVVTGSLGMALQGVPVEIHDIDIQTDKDGAYEIERCFTEYVVKSVHYSESVRIRSHFGALEIDGIKVEIMGDVQKRLDDKGWETSVKVESYRLWVELGEMRVPVLSLAYEYQAYLRLGRTEKAKMLQTWLQMNRESYRKTAGEI